MRLLATAEAVDRFTQKPCSWLMHVCTGRILALSSPCSCKHPSTGDGNSFSLPSGNAERKSEEKMDKIEIASWEEDISRCAAAFASCHEDPTTASVWTFWLPPTSILWAHCTLIPSTSNLVSCRILTWILSHQFGSFKSSMCLSLCTALKSLHLMQCLKPEACRRFRSWTGTYENDSSVKQKTVSMVRWVPCTFWRDEVCEMIYTVFQSLYMFVFFIASIPHIENQGLHDVGLHLCLRWRSCHWRGLWDYDLQTKLEHHRQIPTNWINTHSPPLYAARSNVMMVD